MTRFQLFTLPTTKKLVNSRFSYILICPYELYLDGIGEYLYLNASSIMRSAILDILIQGFIIPRGLVKD
jgi:hypothetical protein